MRPVFVIVLIGAIVFSGSYFYQATAAICKVPLPYRIGVLDERFNLSFDQARLAAADAEAAWEDATERNLFTYDETADFAINFIFDERQAFSDAEETFKDRLDATEQISEALEDTHADLVAKYNTTEANYQAARSQYEARLAAYNERVESYNQTGGAPADVFDELEAERVALDADQAALNQTVDELNVLVDEINRVGQRGNQLIDTYNRGVETFNDTFGDGREFTQGDYTGDAINIYTFKDGEELRLVLVHELGHAISLDHVEDETAVLHYLLGAQTGYQLTAADLEEYSAVCGAGTIDRFKLLWGEGHYH